MSWYGLYAPRKTPASIIARLYGEVQKVLEDPSVRKRLESMSLSPVGDTPDQFKAFLHEQVARFSEMMMLAGVKPAATY